ncbi:MAG TPA: M28 family peptidase [Candidatus Cybelea sp.]
MDQAMRRLLNLGLPTFMLGAVLAAAGCRSATVPPLPEPLSASASAAQAEIGSGACKRRRNDTIDKLEQCIRLDSLWKHLAQFALIADEHPGKLGHPNRNIGTPGYAASVAYVAKTMREAGYRVKIQTYVYDLNEIAGAPSLRERGHSYAYQRDWFVARLSGSGTLTGAVEPPRAGRDGCDSHDFSGFRRGAIALLGKNDCDFDSQVANAQAAGAGAVILYDAQREAYEARLVDRARIPVIGTLSPQIAHGLLREYLAGRAPAVQIELHDRSRSGHDYNVIADAPYGNPSRTVVVEGHLDSIYGAGMLDNASGSATILEIALALAKTPTRNHLRFVWFGGEEVGLLGSRYYTKHLSPEELHKIAFDVDADVTATPNYDILIADPANANKVDKFPPNVVRESKIGNAYFAHYFKNSGIIFRDFRHGNNGTDSLSFALAGVPNTGILTAQDCCKRHWETALWGGFLGNYEGKIPSFNGGCVDRPHRWCDNLSNNDPFVFVLVSKAVAYVTFELANRANFKR